MNTLNNILLNMTVEHLAIRARLIDDSLRCTRKAELIDAIKRGYDGDHY